jgi:hypothetical protein
MKQNQSIGKFLADNQLSHQEVEELIDHLINDNARSKTAKKLHIRFLNKLTDIYDGKSENINRKLVRLLELDYGLVTESKIIAKLTKFDSCEYFLNAMFDFLESHDLQMPGLMLNGIINNIDDKLKFAKLLEKYQCYNLDIDNINFFAKLNCKDLLKHVYKMETYNDNNDKSFIKNDGSLSTLEKKHVIESYLLDVIPGEQSLFPNEYNYTNNEIKALFACKQYHVINKLISFSSLCDDFVFDEACFYSLLISGEYSLLLDCLKKYQISDKDKKRFFDLYLTTNNTFWRSGMQFNGMNYNISEIKILTEMYNILNNNQKPSQEHIKNIIDKKFIGLLHSLAKEYEITFSHENFRKYAIESGNCLTSNQIIKNDYIGIIMDETETNVNNMNETAINETIEKLFNDIVFTSDDLNLVCKYNPPLIKFILNQKVAPTPQAFYLLVNNIFATPDYIDEFLHYGYKLSHQDIIEVTRAGLILNDSKYTQIFVPDREFYKECEIGFMPQYNENMYKDTVWAEVLFELLTKDDINNQKIMNGASYSPDFSHGMQNGNNMSLGKSIKVGMIRKTQNKNKNKNYNINEMEMINDGTGIIGRMDMYYDHSRNNAKDDNMILMAILKLNDDAKLYLYRKIKSYLRQNVSASSLILFDIKNFYEEYVLKHIPDMTTEKIKDLTRSFDIFNDPFEQNNSYDDNDNIRSNQMVDEINHFSPPRNRMVNQIRNSIPIQQQNGEQYRGNIMHRHEDMRHDLQDQNQKAMIERGLNNGLRRQIDYDIDRPYLPPKNSHSIKNTHLINIYRPIGVNTIGGPVKYNPNNDLCLWFNITEKSHKNKFLDEPDRWFSVGKKFDSNTVNGLKDIKQQLKNKYNIDNFKDIDNLENDPDDDVIKTTKKLRKHLADKYNIHDLDEIIYGNNNYNNNDNDVIDGHRNMGNIPHDVIDYNMNDNISDTGFNSDHSDNDIIDEKNSEEEDGELFLENYKKKTSLMKEKYKQSGDELKFNFMDKFESLMEQYEKDKKLPFENKKWDSDSGADSNFDSDSDSDSD